MNHILVSLFIIVAAAYSQTRNFKAEFQELCEKEQYDKAEILLNEWKRANANDPEVYVARANYFFGKAKKNVYSISTSPKNPSEFVLRKPDSSQIVGYFGETAIYDSTIAQEAVKSLTEAIRKFPSRLDIRFGLAHIYQELGDFDSQYQVLVDAIRGAKSYANKLTWSEGAKLSEPAYIFIPKTLHEYAQYYWRKETERDDKKFLKIATLTVTHYPKHIYAINDIANYYAIKKNWNKALEYYLKAHAVDTSDCVVMVNSGYAYANLKDKNNAKRYYQTVINQCKDERSVATARERLKELK